MPTGVKRPFEQDGAIVKRQKTSHGEIIQRPDENAILPAGIRRTSNLNAPIMELTGHQVCQTLLSPHIRHQISHTNNSTGRSVLKQI
jgi:hypothetical protein